ncbi:MAG TPA: DUF4293 domain-containing protein [Chitinophagaceae bacterium]|nr:DUF4293 domain-containing protein [Chitinophagaceae bacterium]
MIQRRQTLWLILATVCAFLSFQFPFVTGKEAVPNSNAMLDVVIDAASNFFLLILTGASIVLSMVTIFLFKDRKLQQNLCLLGILISLGIIIIYIVQYLKIITPTPALWAVLPFLVLISYIMALRGIRHDEKLIKSLNKLR